MLSQSLSAAADGAMWIPETSHSPGPSIGIRARPVGLQLELIPRNDPFTLTADLTILYDGDSEDMAERYVVGNLEEEVDGADVISPSSPLGAALQGAEAGQQVTYEAPNGALSVTVLGVESV